MKPSERLYRLMLCLYPSEFRREYDPLMMQSFRDMRRDAAGRGLSGLLSFWLYLLAETISQALIEHRDAIRNYKGNGFDYTPSKADLLLLFVPVVGIMTVLYAVNESQNTMLVYLLILIAGVGGWLLSRLKLFRANPLWNTYVLGILLGTILLIAYLFSGIPALGIYRLGLPPLTILIVSLAIYAAGIGISGRLVGSQVRRYRMTAVLLALTATAALMISSRRPTDAITFFVSLNYSFMQALVTLILSAVSIAMMRFIGQRALILLMIAIGVQFIFVDPGYFTDGAGRWINLSTLLFPLVICPVWLLLAKTRRTRLRGTFLLWALLIGIVAIAPSVARVAMQLDYETPDIWIHRALMTLPYLASVWLALRAADKQDRDLGEQNPPHPAMNNPAPTNDLASADG